MSQLLINDIIHSIPSSKTLRNESTKPFSREILQNASHCKVIFITGCSRGIGLEFVKQFLKLKFFVIATCRNPQNAIKLQLVKQKYHFPLSLFKFCHRNESF